MVASKENRKTRLKKFSPKPRGKYSYVSNKRRATFILFEEKFQALRSYSRPYVSQNHFSLSKPIFTPHID